MSASEPKALRQGRQHRQRERRRDAVRRVRDYQRWLKAGSELRRIPAIPSDADFKLARGER